jgi:hypothetical protein
MRHLLFAAVLAALLVTPGFAQETQVQSTTGVSAVFYAGVPFEGGQAIAVAGLDAEVTEDLAIADAGYVRLIVGSASYVFMIADVADPGQPAGATLVHVDGATRSLTEVSAELMAAMNASANVLVFTNGGPGDQGVVTAIVNVGKITASTNLPVAASTHVSVIAHGQIQWFAIVSLGTTLGTIVVSADEGTQIELAMTGDTDTLLNILGLIGVGFIAP